MNNKHSDLIELSGGTVDGMFVIKPGIIITQASETTPDFFQVSDGLNIDSDRPAYEQHAEFNSRLTYMSFKNQKISAENYNSDMVDNHQHLSVYNDCSVTFLLAGISIEASLEIISHNEATVSRLTSSKTKAQSNPLFVINPTLDLNLQKNYIAEVINVKSKYNFYDLETDNRLFPCNKAVSMTVAMSLKNWHKTLIGRLSNVGVEREVVVIFETICDILHAKYPLVIKDKSHYYSMGNGKKYSE